LHTTNVVFRPSLVSLSPPRDSHQEDQGATPVNLETVDREGNTALHFAYHGAKYDTIALLLEEYDDVSVSKWNAHKNKKLPFDLLFESNVRSWIQKALSTWRASFDLFLLHATVLVERRGSSTYER
jgi:hypothetical protein